jgi:nucleotide-binding universal stress UspA family protein
VLHVDGEEESSVARVEQELELLGRGAGDWARVDVRAIGARGSDVAETIVRTAVDERADLVVLGTRGLGVDDEDRLGSVSARVTTRLSLPMLLVPPRVWRAYAAVP